MKKLMKISLTVLAMLFFSVACTDDDYELGTITTPSNLMVTSEVVGQTEDMPDGDGSGTVNFNASADNAMTYKFIYGDGFEDVSATGESSHSFNENGVNDYTVTVIASGTGGASSSMSTTVTVFSDFSDPETKQLLTGDGSKTWYIAASEPGHLKLGPSAEPYFITSWYAAVPFEKAEEDESSCFYTDEMTFSLNENEEIIYDYNNYGATFFNVAFIEDFGGGGGSDVCLAYDAPTDQNVSLTPSGSNVSEEFSTGTSMNIAGGGTIGYYVGNSSYEIISITENRMVIRTTSTKNPEQAWYMTLTTSPEEEETEEFESQFNTEIWSDEFDGDALNTDNWNYEIGNGDNGWGNNEAQYYTDAEDNVKVEDGNLVITAKREAESGFNFTSARITTKDKFEFTYGRVEVRAKLPAGGGTWAAIWMLGAEWPEEAWPGVGEMDIMEFVGNDPGKTISALHFPGNSGGDAIVDDTQVSDATSEFHIYEVEWTTEKITFLVDGIPHLEFDNDDSTPFQDDFYLLLNIAMGGTLGGNIADDFQESSMEIDYVKVYQE